MELAVTPPPCVAAGLKLHSPLVVTFSGPPTTGERRQENDQAFTLSTFSGIWVFLSLTTSDMTQSLSPPRNDLFNGTKADSIHQVYCEQDSDRRTVAYATFPDLAITRPGSYRIKATLIDMNA